METSLLPRASQWLLPGRETELGFAPATARFPFAKYSKRGIRSGGLERRAGFTAQNAGQEPDLWARALEGCDVVRREAGRGCRKGGGML